jgi:hypothetical protein
MAAIKLKAGESVVVAAVDPSLEIGGGPMPGGGDQPVDPGYGIDLGLGWLRPTHPIVLPPPVEPPVQPPEPPPVDPAYGIDEDAGYVRPSHPIVLPPPPSGGGPAPNWELKTAWTPSTGWVVVAVPTGEHVTPSKRK